MFQLFSTLGTLVLSLELTLAAPTTPSVNIVPTANYTQLTHHHVHPSFARRETPSQMIEDGGQVAYTTPVEIGRKTFNLFVDTGSHITWVTTAKHTCRTLDNEVCQIGAANAHLDVTSEELAAVGGVFDISYGDRSNATGVYVDRPISLAGVTIPNQAIGAATKVYVRNVNAAKWMDGMLGLGPWVGKDFPSPFFNALWNVGLSVPQFSIALFGDTDNNGASKRDGGLLAFGGYPDSLELTSKWAAAPLITGETYGKWYTINVDGYVLNGKKISNGGIPMIVDSGTTITKLPRAVAYEVFKLLPGTGTDPERVCQDGMPDDEKCLSGGLWKIPCNGKVPSFSVVVGEIEFALQQDNMNVLLGNKVCVAGIRPGEAGDNKGTLGFSFMKNDVVVLHDYTNEDKPRIMMATYKDKEN